MIEVARQLIVSVDTEEEGLWGGQYKVENNTTENLRGLPRFQQVCEQLGVPPTYLIDAPVLSNLVAVDQLRLWQDENRCEVGAHCHAWCNPPLTNTVVNSKESYLCNHPAEVQRQKLEWLTEGIAKAMGKRPTSYRAGRYGFDHVSAEILDDLGYVVDSSVLPMHDYRSRGGPNFLMSDRQPHPWFSEESGRKLWEIPVTAGFVAGNYNRRRELWINLRKKPWTSFRLAGIADRLGLTRRVKLTPEGTQISDIVRLIDRCHAEGLSTLVLMLHSSSLAVGYSPYARDAAQLEHLYKRIRESIQYAIERYGYRPVTLTQAAIHLSAKDAITAS